MKKSIGLILLLLVLFTVCGCGCSKASLETINISILNENQLGYKYSSNGKAKMITDMNTNVKFVVATSPIGMEDDVECHITDDSIAKIDNYEVVPLKEGTVTLYCSLKDVTSNNVEIEIGG